MWPYLLIIHTECWFSEPTSLGDLNINTVRPKDLSLSVFSKRKETYRCYPESNPVSADKLCEAGFFYEGVGDKVKCFWCDGALEMWSKGACKVIY